MAGEVAESNIHVALVQFNASADPQENLRFVERSVTAAAADGAELVVFPEATMCRFGVSLKPVAEPADGPWATELERIAKAARVTVVAGMFTPAPDGRVYNTVIVRGIDRENRAVRADYHKIHLFDAFGFSESDTVAPGENPVVFDLAGTRIGIATCYDVRFPNLFYALADQGAEIIAVLASWGDGPSKVAQWRLMTAARALDSTSFILACGQSRPAGEKATAPLGVGYSAVIAPSGEILQSLEGSPGMLTADVDLAVVSPLREQIPVLKNRRL